MYNENKYTLAQEQGGVNQVDMSNDWVNCENKFYHTNILAIYKCTCICTTSNIDNERRVKERQQMFLNIECLNIDNYVMISALFIDHYQITMILSSWSV